MTVLIIGILLVVFGVMICYLNYEMESRIVERANRKNRKIIPFPSVRRHARFFAKHRRNRRNIRKIKAGKVNAVKVNSL